MGGRMRGGRGYRCGTISCLPLTREVARLPACRRECPIVRSRGQRFQRKAFSLGLCPAQRIEITMTAGGSHTTTTRCHALRRDGCGVYRISGRSERTYRVPSTPVTACAVPPSVSRRGLFSVPADPTSIFATQLSSAGASGHAAAPTMLRWGALKIWQIIPALSLVPH